MPVDPTNSDGNKPNKKENLFTSIIYFKEKKNKPINNFFEQDFPAFCLYIKAPIMKLWPVSVQVRPVTKAVLVLVLLGGWATYSGLQGDRPGQARGIGSSHCVQARP